MVGKHVLQKCIMGGYYLDVHTVLSFCFHSGWGINIYVQIFCCFVVNKCLSLWQVDSIL